MQFRLARPEEASVVYALYRSVIGTPFCTWNEVYPGLPEIEADLWAGGLFVLAEGERIIGALSVVPENELDHLPGWTVRAGAREIGRVVTRLDVRGRGLAGLMVERIADRLRAGGCSALHLSVAEVNLPARKTYEALGFQTVAQVPLYGGTYLLMEKIL